jgi:hypothetical protein
VIDLDASRGGVSVDATGTVAYLNHAGTGPLPARTVRALGEWDRIRAEPWRNTAKEQFGARAFAGVVRTHDRRGA